MVLSAKSSLHSPRQTSAPAVRVMAGKPFWIVRRTSHSPSPITMNSGSSFKTLRGYRTGLLCPLTPQIFRISGGGYGLYRRTFSSSLFRPRTGIVKTLRDLSQPSSNLLTVSVMIPRSVTIKSNSASEDISVECQDCTLTSLRSSVDFVERVTWTRPLPLPPRLISGATQFALSVTSLEACPLPSQEKQYQTPLSILMDADRLTSSWSGQCMFHSCVSSPVSLSTL